MKLTTKKKTLPIVWMPIENLFCLNDMPSTKNIKYCFNVLNETKRFPEQLAPLVIKYRQNRYLILRGDAYFQAAIIMGMQHIPCQINQITKNGCVNMTNRLTELTNEYLKLEEEYLYLTERIDFLKGQIKNEMNVNDIKKTKTFQLITSTRNVIKASLIDFSKIILENNLNNEIVLDKKLQESLGEHLEKLNVSIDSKDILSLKRLTN